MHQHEDTMKGKVLHKNLQKSSQGFLDIKNMTIWELDEILERQNKLLQNRHFLQSLPDKGRKIHLFVAELEGERIKKQKENTSINELIGALSLKETNPEDIEWNSGKSETQGKQLDSDDEDDDHDDDNNDGNKNEGYVDHNKEESNILKVIATHSGTASGKNIKKFFLDSTLKNKGLKVIEQESYTDKVCAKYGDEKIFKERFKPNHLPNNQNLFITSAQMIKKKLGSKWEVTQATPPVPVYRDTLMISLTESLKLQKEQAEKLKEIESKRAAEKLFLNASVKVGDKLPIYNINEYRNPLADNSDCEENESYESDNDSREETVTYTIKSDEFENLSS